MISTNSLKELIDTLWNVNFYSANLYFRRLPELIDTLWNVNFLRSYMFCSIKKN